MSMLFVMIPLALVLLALAVAAFFWAVRTGQFDDLEKHGMLVLFDDEPVAPPPAGRPGGEPRAGEAPPGRADAAAAGAGRFASGGAGMPR